MSATAQSTDSPIARTLRLSITGECNLDCFYCRPLGRSRDLLQTKTLIQPSDVSKLVRIVGEFGVNRIVISGGEPLLRKDVPNFVKAAYAHKNIQDVRLVTNGTYLKAYADTLRKMGLRKVDVSFDSLRYERYQAITRRDDLFRVLDGIEKVEKLNYTEIRLNVRLLNGINEDELVEFARLTKVRRVNVRFLEYHPLHAEREDPYASRLGLSVLTAKRRIDDYQRLVQVHDLSVDPPVPTFQFADGVGRISFLSHAEVAREASVPVAVFNAEGVLFHEQVPTRPQAILADLRRDAKEARLHKTIERVLMLRPAAEKPKAPRAAAAAARARSGRNQAAVARR
jgi:cyclic pyranopterin phosphate synthase